MLICPQCQTQNQDAARFCSGCGVAFSPVTPISAPKKRYGALFWVLAILGGVALCGFCSTVFNTIDKEAKTQLERANTVSNNSAPPLKLLSSRGESDDNFYTVTGEVQNISDEKLESVWVVVSVYDKSGQLITSEDGVLEYQPLMPGQTSPFRRMIRANPLMSTYTIGFKKIRGGVIDYIDARPSKKETKGKK